MVEKTGALQGHAPEMVGDAPLMRKGLASGGRRLGFRHIFAFVQLIVRTQLYESVLRSQNNAIAARTSHHFSPFIDTTAASKLQSDHGVLPIPKDRLQHGICS